MEEVGESCKFCLTYIQADGLVTLNDKFLDKMDFLQINLDQSAKESNFLCKKCEGQIENAFNFKTLLANSNQSSGSQDISQNTPNTSTDRMLSEQIICHLCKNSVDKLSTISLGKLLKDDSMVEVFQGHIPEVDLENFEENSMVCESCQKSLVHFWTVVELWHNNNYCNNDDMIEDMDSVEMLEDEEENLDHLVEGAFMDSPCTFEVSNNPGNNLETKKAKSEKRQLINDDASESCNNKIKSEISESGESVSLTCKDVKKEATEDHQEAEIEELELQSEELIIKDEDRLSGRSKLLPFLLQVRPRENKNKDKCNKCSNQTIYEQNLLTHKSLDEVKVYSCKPCSHETKYKNLDDVEVYKCNECSFVTKYKHSLKGHLSQIHKRLDDEDLLYGCKQCFYKSKYKRCLIRHILKHKKFDDVGVYKCEECSFVTKYKYSLKYHLLSHNSLNEIKLYKCKQCSYITIYETSLKIHLLSHKNLTEVKVYKCKECSFVTKYEGSLNKHLLTHRS